ncbi:MAG TPA: hypothetical protein DF774_02215 [Rheinheimera sp.]|uniref:hypothetical protein n=1 Tax=Rheinheimera sp. TaxID=1869214 RepID=UPI000EDFBC2C|nr:hypothetical protein [Rheinheimera sp.]HCU64555.1 hypothetical protein [Rheinheimera sp.]
MSDKPNLKPGPKDYGHEYNEHSPLDQLAQELERKLSDTIYDRGGIDTRMVEDLRNYHGIYDAGVVKQREEAKRSSPFIKLTRAKTNTAESQIIDLLFPNDDKNYGIKPTPVPEISKVLNSKEPALVDGQQYKDAEGNIITEGDLAARKMALLQERSEAMEKEIDDQLVECQYNAKARQVIHDACVIGTGIIKGPVVVGKMDKAYVEVAPGQFAMEMKESFTPAVEVVRPWDFFPDMSASCIAEAEFVFERRYMSRQQIKGLSQRRGFPVEQINRILNLKAEQTQHTSVYQDDVRQLAGLSDTLNDTRYETWEYHGPISMDVLMALKVIDTPEDPKELAALAGQDVIATVFYCGGVVLGARTQLMEHEGYLPYRVFNWEPDDSSIFGYGVPRMVRDEQAVINSVWRMMLDNGAITAGPQIGINKDLIDPENGSWQIEPFKVWHVKKSVRDIKEAFSTFEFSNHLTELAAVYQTARVLFDEVSGIPMLGQGEQGQSTQTLGGMSMLMNAANTVRRRQVKAWDDNITSPLIKDFYHYNMEHSEKTEIKGDYQVDARGTSALLVKETQAQALTNFLAVIGNNPVFTPVLQIKSAEILRQWAKTQSLPSTLLPTDDELRAYQEKMQKDQENQPQDPSVQIEQLRAEQQKAKQEFEMKLAQFNAQNEAQQAAASNQIKLQQIGADMQANASRERIEMMKLAQNDKLNTEKLMTELKKNQAKLDQDWQTFMAEVQIKLQAGMTANFGLAQA